MTLLSKWALAVLVTGFSAIAAADSIKVIDENNQPVANATVLLGFEQDNPFPNNIVKTGADGVTGVPSDWKSALPVTVQATGFVTTTIPVMEPGVHTITVSKADGTANLEVKGTTQNFGRILTDGKVDFGLVIPSLTRQNMLAFDIGTVMSPQVDTMDLGFLSIDVPSNVTLPNQDETYIFSITLDKPDYRFYLREPGNYDMYALHGQFPLKKVVDDIRGGKSIFEVVNYFNFLETGSKTLTVNNNMSGVNLDVNQTAFNSTYAVKAPNFANDKVMISLAVAENNSRFVPTDIKRLTPGQSMNLKTNTGLGAGAILSMLLDEPTNIVEPREVSPLRILNPLEALAFYPLQQQRQPMPAAKDYNFTKMTFAVLPAGGTVMPDFLEMIDKPTMSGNVFTLDMPALPNGLTAASMYLVLAEVETLGTGNMKSERRTRLWEVWAPGWMSQVEMPKVTFNKNPNFKYRWEAMFLARPSSVVFGSNAGNRADLNQITHITRNAMDL